MSVAGILSMRRLLAASALSALLSVGAAFAAPDGVHSSATPVPSLKSNNAAKPVVDDSELHWSDLKPQQQQILAPLSSEWDKMDGVSRQKWLKIAGRFSKATPEELQRIHARMQEWLKLTPEQRRIVRENHTRTKKLDPVQKSAEWQQYQNLPEDQKKKLAASVSPKKHVANLPPHDVAKPAVPPLKSKPKKAPEKSVTPGAPIQPSPSPAPITPKQP